MSVIREIGLTLCGFALWAAFATVGINYTHMEPLVAVLLGYPFAVAVMIAARGRLRDAKGRGNDPENTTQTDEME